MRQAPDAVVVEVRISNMSSSNWADAGDTSKATRVAGHALLTLVINGDYAAVRENEERWKSSDVLDYCDSDGITALIAAAGHCNKPDPSHKMCFKVLIDLGAAQHKADIHKKTALMLLAADNVVDCIEYLALTSGSGTVDAINAQDIHGDSALIKAARRGHSSSVSCLIKLHADVNLTDEDHSSALFEAAREVAKFLDYPVFCSVPQ